MLTHISMPDENTKKFAKLSAFVERCSDLSLSPENLTNAYLSAAAQILTVSSYDNKLYAKTYSESRQELFKATRTNLATECGKFNNESPLLVNQMIERYNNISSERKADMAGIANISSALSQIQPPNIKPYIAGAPSTTPNFRLNTPKTTNYLVNSNQGYQLRQCTVTASGVAICR